MITLRFMPFADDSWCVYCVRIHIITISFLWSCSRVCFLWSVTVSQTPVCTQVCFRCIGNVWSYGKARKYVFIYVVNGTKCWSHNRGLVVVSHFQFYGNSGSDQWKSTPSMQPTWNTDTQFIVKYQMIGDGSIAVIQNGQFGTFTSRQLQNLL